MYPRGRGLKFDPLTEKLKEIRRRGLMEKVEGRVHTIDDELMAGRSLEVAAGPEAVAAATAAAEVATAGCCDANDNDNVESEADDCNNKESLFGEDVPTFALEGVDIGCADCGKELTSGRPPVNVDHLESVADNVMILSGTVDTLMARVDALEKFVEARFNRVDQDMKDGGSKLDYRSLGGGGGGGGPSNYASLSS
jgi:outer membrane murein-binding lipoprotein Lpp